MKKFIFTSRVRLNIDSRSPIRTTVNYRTVCILVNRVGMFFRTFQFTLLLGQLGVTGGFVIKHDFKSGSGSEFGSFSPKSTLKMALNVSWITKNWKIKKSRDENIFVFRNIGKIGNQSSSLKFIKLVEIDFTQMDIIVTNRRDLEQCPFSLKIIHWLLINLFRIHMFY